jgi:hypothetical protein
LLWPRGRQLGSDEAPEGVAGELEAVQAHRVEPAGEPVAELCGSHRMAEAGQIDDVHAPPGGQLAEHR